MFLYSICKGCLFLLFPNNKKSEQSNLVHLSFSHRLSKVTNLKLENCENIYRAEQYVCSAKMITPMRETKIFVATSIRSTGVKVKIALSNLRHRKKKKKLPFNGHSQEKFRRKVNNFLDLSLMIAEHSFPTIVQNSIMG